MAAFCGRIIVIVVFAVFISSCSSASSPRGSGVADELRIAEPVEASSVGPSDDGAYHMWPLVYSCLLQPDQNDGLIPDLATTVPSLANGLVSQDGLTIDYPLRQNVVWQDGSPFTAADVVFTYHQILNSHNNYSRQYPYSSVASVTAVNPHLIRVRMAHVYAPIVSKFFASGSCYPIVPQHLLAQYSSFRAIPFNARPTGTGPYQVTSFNSGDHVDFQANPAYFRGRPKIAKLSIVFTPDKNTLMTRLRTGELDATFGASPAQAAVLKSVSGLTVSTFRQSVVGTLTFNVSDPVMSDARLREAIRYALDRETIGKSISMGYFDAASAAREALGWAYDPADPQPAYDLAKASALLDTLGWVRGTGGMRSRNGKKLQLLLVSRQDGIDPNADVQIQGALAHVGIDVIIKTYSDPQFNAPASDGGIFLGARFQMMYYPLSWQGFDSDYSAELKCGNATPKGDNYSRYCDAAVDAANRAAYSTFDRAIRKRYYAIVQRRLFENPPWVFLWTVPKIDIYTNRLKRFLPSNMRTSYYRVNDWQLDSRP